MYSLEFNTSMRVTSEELTPAQFIELVQVIQKCQSPGAEGNNGPGATLPVDHSGKNGRIILPGSD